MPAPAQPTLSYPCRPTFPSSPSIAPRRPSRRPAHPAMAAACAAQPDPVRSAACCLATARGPVPPCNGTRRSAAIAAAWPSLQRASCAGCRQDGTHSAAAASRAGSPPGKAATRISKRCSRSPGSRRQEPAAFRRSNGNGARGRRCRLRESRDQCLCWLWSIFGAAAASGLTGALTSMVLRFLSLPSTTRVIGTVSPSFICCFRSISMT